MLKSRISLFATVLFLVFAGRVQAECNFQTVTGVTFGSYDALSGFNLDSAGSISVTCDKISFVTTTIGPSHNSGGFNPRQMRNTASSDLMNYNLYTDAARTVIWGDGTQGTSAPTVIVRKKRAWTRTVYGRIPSRQNVGIGQYSEALVMTINF
jgi:spore coat protein U-like protein